MLRSIEFITCINTTKNQSYPWTSLFITYKKTHTSLKLLWLTWKDMHSQKFGDHIYREDKTENQPAWFVAYQQFLLVALLWLADPPMHSSCHLIHGLYHCVWSLVNRPHMQPHPNPLSNPCQQLHWGAVKPQIFHLQYYLVQILVNSQVQGFVPVGKKLSEWVAITVFYDT